MSTLTNQQIKATYQGLIKTADNAAIDATPKALEDGVGNTLPIEVGTGRINFTDTIDFSGATVTGLPEGPQGPQGPQGLIGDQGVQGPIGPQGIEGAQGPQGLIGDQGVQGPIGPQGIEGAQGPQGPQGLIGDQGVQGPTGADGVLQSIVAGTNVTVDATDPANPIVSASGGGGGGSTPAMSLSELPLWDYNSAGGNAWKSWVEANAYSTTNQVTVVNSGTCAIFPVAEGEIISKVQFSVGISGVGDVNAAFYYIEKDANGFMKIGNKAIDLGGVASTSGLKVITLGTPFVFPSGQPYGSLILIVAFTDAQGAFTAWNTSNIWPSRSCFNFGDITMYRTINLTVLNATAGVLPADGSSFTYSGSTSNPLWAFIQ